MIKNKTEKLHDAVLEAVREAPREPGQKLPNGATIIASRFDKPDSEYGERHIVLAIVEGWQPYVVWTRLIGAAESSAGTFDPLDYTINGEYHRNLEAAVAAYRAR